jgi:DNA relaxase NicK
VVLLTTSPVHTVSTGPSPNTGPSVQCWGKQAGLRARRQLDRAGRTRPVLLLGPAEERQDDAHYEKGKQLGDRLSEWMRSELELRNKRREIPWNVLRTPGAYVAGAYPCTTWVSKELSRIMTLRKTTEITYDTLTAC